MKKQFEVPRHKPEDEEEKKEKKEVKEVKNNCKNSVISIEVYTNIDSTGPKLKVNIPKREIGESVISIPTSVPGLVKRRRVGLKNAIQNVRKAD